MRLFGHPLFWLATGVAGIAVTVGWAVTFVVALTSGSASPVQTIVVAGVALVTGFGTVSAFQRWRRLRREPVPEPGA